MRLPTILPLFMALSSLLAGCEHNTDLIAKLNAEPLPHTNESNLAAMVANPADLVHGHDAGPQDSTATVQAIERIKSDHPKALSTPGGSSGGGGGGSGGGASGG